MKLDKDKLKVDESRSNPMVVALQYADCPINEICMYVATGLTGGISPCKHLNEDDEEGECLYDVAVSDETALQG